MTLPRSPNRTTPASIRDGDEGWPVYALQRALCAHGKAIASDGDFGPNTKSKVKDAQRRLGLTADGIAGPKTQTALCVELADDLSIHGLPSGLARSLMEGESGYFLGAVNWSVAGGVDVSVMQRRVFGPPYSPTILMDAYDPMGAIRWSLNLLDRRAQDFYDSPGVRRRSDRLEYSIRLALLAHNWPWAAGELAAGRALSTTKPATWVPKGLKFPDGGSVISYSDWAQFYALGGRHGEARMTKYVKRWPS